MNLYEPCTQAQFGELVGVTQQAVGDMISRGVFAAGLPLGNQLQSYCHHLREAAAGREGGLARERELETKVRRELGEIKLAEARREYAPVAALEQVLAAVGRAVAGHLEPLPGQIHKLCPQLTPEDVARIQAEVSRACDVAAGASLALLIEPEEEEGAAGEGGEGGAGGADAADAALFDEDDAA
jgi:hypothetical protein